MPAPARGRARVVPADASATRGTVTLTFDNLGEAADIEAGVWPEGKPVGRHPSVTTVLPRLLDALAARRLPATFYVEAINVETYPDAVRSIAAAGHEVGHHAWRHERWRRLDERAEAEIIRRGMAAYRTLGIVPRSFRPPGGALNPGSSQLLLAAGIDVCSAAGVLPGMRDGVVHLPFRWELVDAFWMMQELAPVRETRGQSATPLGPEPFHSEVRAALDTAVRSGDHVTLVVHPFLLGDDAAWAAFEDLLDRVTALHATGRLGVLRGAEVAEQLRRTSPAAEPVLD